MKPRKFQDILRRTVEESCHDLSVSRTRSRLHWGIPVPEDETQTVNNYRLRKEISFLDLSTKATV